MHARNYDQEHGFIRPSEVDFTRLNERGIDLSGRGFVRSNEH